MYILVSFESKFKTNIEKIESILQHYGLRKIQSHIYAGELNNNERETLVSNIAEDISKKDSVLVIPICKSCYLKKKHCGREIKFKDDLFRVYV